MGNIPVRLEAITIHKDPVRHWVELVDSPVHGEKRSIEDIDLVDLFRGNKCYCIAQSMTFDLDPEKKTILITGASQGARSINDALLAIADQLATQRDWQLLHLTGEADESRVKDGYAAAGVPAVVHAFIDRMPEALARVR